MSLILSVLAMLTQMSLALHEICRMVELAQSQGRDLNEDEMKVIDDKYKASFSRLRAAIEAKQ